MVIRSRFRLFQTELAPQFGSQTGSGPEVGLELVAGRIGLGIENIAFPDYQVPAAILRLKQGFGRLIR